MIGRVFWLSRYCQDYEHRGFSKYMRVKVLDQIEAWASHRVPIPKENGEGLEGNGGFLSGGWFHGNILFKRTFTRVGEWLSFAKIHCTSAFVRQRPEGMQLNISGCWIYTPVLGSIFEGAISWENAFVTLTRFVFLSSETSGSETGLSTERM